jgi:signal transduction histidine kinase
MVTNAFFDSLFGESEGGLCYTVMKGRDGPCEECIAAATFADGEEHHAKESGTSSDERAITLEVDSLPVHDDGGNVDYALLAALDTTRLGELEHQLRQSERLATIGLTTAGLAHSIKSILAGLEGGIYVVNSGIKKDDRERIENGWDMVQRYIERVSSLVRNLLRYAKAEEPHREEVDTGELVRQTVELFVDKADLMNVELEADIDEDVPTLWLDREGMRGCLANLLSNSLDACVWDPDTEKEHRIVVAAKIRDHGGVRFAIRDNGMGISPENQRKILVSSFTTKGIRGTGLGLLLTQKAVAEHGGTVSFDSTHGEGTTFIIDLPETDAPDASAQSDPDGDANDD